MKIVVLDGSTLNTGDLSWEALQQLGELIIYDRTPSDKIIERIGEAKYIFTNKTPLGEEVFQACPSLSYIGVLATGYNVVDVEAAKKYGITVTNIPSYGTDTVAQFTFSLLLELCHQIGAHSRSVLSGEWCKSIDFCYWNTPQIELAGKTIGIIGYGKIGQATARIAQAFGMKVLVYSRTIRKEFEKDPVSFVPLDTLLENSDVISLHCPLFPETKEIINKASISKMKDGVLLINTSRGGLLNEQDVKEALDSGKIGGAAVDVVSIEPIKENNPLLSSKNIIITPHMAWASIEARQRLMDTATNNLAEFLKGYPINVVS